MFFLVFLGFWWFLGVPNGRKLILGPWQSRSNLIFIDFGPKSLIFGFSWILGIPKLLTFFEDFDPMWPLQRSYCLENVRILSLSILGFHQNLSKILIFISQSPPFYENPISSVRPSETQNSRFLCVHPHSGGVVGFSIIGFSSMTPPGGRRRRRRGRDEVSSRVQAQSTTRTQGQNIPFGGSLTPISP